MTQEVFLGQLHQVAVAQHIGVGPHGLFGHAFGGIENFKVARELGVAQAGNLALRGEAVIDHLVERQRGPPTGVVAVGHARIGLPLATNAGGQVDPRIVATARHILLFLGGQVGMPSRLHFRVAHHGTLDRLSEGFGGGGLQ